ncbi:F0F1-type ATP synthase membrane subunit b/b' [Kineococcus radiotolerans]|uniref:Uncharacterized protein n=2 Tax=Kineococcus radiotolerans TaxID=131568 RepID=A6W659_KINRD|nr:hypothetical protein [Kineococcus radiotolerans]ABS02298.1 conserved hypothetical protein [Kineococcus radiotolerans SRS30216 = ATCC BAA-149]MBB2900533.1 F0F1-type ATP synthase membrane subunit b/b' [Kineococcus radiotolerans]
MTQGTGNGSGSTAADLGHDPLVTGTPYGTTGGQSRPEQTAGAAKEQASAVAGTAKHQASAVAGTAKEQAAAVAGTAKEQASAVAGTAKEQASAVAGTAVDQAGNVLAEAKDQAVDLFADLRRQLSEQSDAVRDRIAEFLTGAGSELADMAGAGGGSGYATQVVRQVGDRASSWGSHLTNHDSADLLEQTRSFARRKPGTFLLGALLTGVVAGRLTRGAKAHHDVTQVETTSTDLTPRPVTTSVMTPAAVPPVVAPTTPFVSPDVDVATGVRPTTPYERDASLIDPPEYRP